ncbi:MAG: GH3 auxin-responsive promoter family protein [Fibrobacteria bacterium]|nr:GH3 auxin-responsive promoter family protein [Fibrobacteria bacterium]
MQNSEAIQNNLLRQIILKNQNTAFGQHYGFNHINTLAEFRERVPLLDYEDFQPYIESLSFAHQSSLTADPVLLFEPTSGSASPTKLIPYTSGLKQEFQRAVNVWLYDVYRHYPGLLGTKSYWSVSPRNDGFAQTKSGIPVGFEHDSDYLGFSKVFLNHTFAVPGGVSCLRHIDNFWYCTGLFLLRCRALGLISVWNPTYLELLTDAIEKYFPQLVKDVHDGTLTLPQDEDSRHLLRYIYPDVKRAMSLEQIHTRYSFDGGDFFTSVWPRLQLISCWDQGESQKASRMLRKKIPRTDFQGKGLVATEGIISIPWVKAGGCLPTYTSHFLEFLPEDSDCTKLVHELVKGCRYTPIITTSGGLYRYNMHDKIEVTGHFKGLPVMEFKGRDQVCDMVGEKLHEQQVALAIDKVLSDKGVTALFTLFAPRQKDKQWHYVFYLEPAVNDETAYTNVADALDAELKNNFYYKHARELGQLGRVCLFLIRRNGYGDYIKACCKQGQDLGSIKQVLMKTSGDWEVCFDGYSQKQK